MTRGRAGRAGLPADRGGLHGLSKRRGGREGRWDPALKSVVESAEAAEIAALPEGRRKDAGHRAMPALPRRRADR